MNAVNAARTQVEEVISLSGSQPPIELNWTDNDRVVEINPKDQDQFTATVAGAIKACQATQEFVEFQKSFKLLLVALRLWATGHSDKLLASFLTVRDAGLLFVVLKKEPSYDDDLENSLSDLDLAIARDEGYHSIRLNVLALPFFGIDSTKAFVAPDLALIVSRHIEE